ncbi:MAG: type II toxin-antitoxin system death-on-curing family toxin [Sphingopyxis sp.]|nr:type II toxin-antitoxin system death-on-curing family toxin [Sphingopyxis sp.]
MAWNWVSAEFVGLIHDQQIARFGGGSGLRDEGLLLSALARPENLAAYGDPDVAALAASYAYGIARNHPFVDGNKRTALVTAAVFLLENGHELIAPEADAVVTILALAAGDLTEDALADWIRANIAAA